MKKFYESPMVEFTVFDVEDVITISVATTGEMTAEQITDLVADIEQTLDITVANTGNFNTYSW